MLLPIQSSFSTTQHFKLQQQDTSRQDSCNRQTDQNKFLACESEHLRQTDTHCILNEDCFITESISTNEFQISRSIVKYHKPFLLGNSQH